MSTKRNVNKVKFFEIIPEMMLELLRGAVIDRNVRLITLPADAHFYAIRHTDFARSWHIGVMSDTYDELLEGEAVPRMLSPIVIEADDNGWSLINSYKEGESPMFVMIAGIGTHRSEEEWIDRGWYGNGKWWSDHMGEDECKPTHWRPYPQGPRRKNETG